MTVEVFRTVAVAAIAVSLAVITVGLIRRRRRISPPHLGFDVLLAGLVLVSAAAAIDAARVEEWVEHSFQLGSTVLFVQLIAGYLTGILCVGVGLSLWVPALISFQEESRRRRQAEDALLSTTVEARIREEALALANEVAGRLHRLTDIAEIAREAVAVLVQHSHTPLVAFYLLDEDRATLRLIAEHRFEPDTVEAGRTLPVDGSLSGVALRCQELLVCSDISGDERLEPVIRAALLQHGLASATVIPLINHGECLGTINLIYREHMAPSEVDRRTFQAIGQMVALAIVNARQHADLEHRAHHDPLTELPNRAGLQRELRERLHEADPRAGLIVFDVDRFREVNEALGYQVGDDLLQLVASRLAGAARTVGGSACRLGGDEFAVLLDTTGHPADVEATGQSLIAELRRPYRLSGFDLEVNVAAGVATMPAHGTNGVDLLRSADIALHQAKRTACGLTVYTPEMNRSTPERLALTSDLTAAIANDQLMLFFQPKVTLRQQQLIGFEALVRWRHPQRGLLAPREFIPLAEVTDSIQQLTRWVMRSALTQLAVWRASGHQLTMAINLSARNLNGRDCGTVLKGMADEAGVEPTDIVVELTETALMDDPDRAARALDRIAAEGARLAIDDFGTGYSSLAHLTRFPVSSLKIDQSFVTGMLRSTRATAIVRSTVSMARDLGLMAVAEGVEDDATAQALTEMGCDEAQGFAIGRPEPADRITARLSGEGWAFERPPAAVSSWVAD
jgi:diguanylate cyclase (GGDEF)-like protein